jgi:hypothetical protein
MGDLIFNIIPVIWENSIQAMKTLLINKIIVTVLGILFSIASYALPGIAGDSCHMAIPITVGLTCNPVSYSTIGATSESTAVCPNPNCGFYSGNDIWFTVIVPASGKLRIERTNDGSMNAAIAVYSGTCGAFTQLACQQEGSTSPQVFYTLNNTLYSGQTLYVRAWNRNSAVGGTFSLCVFEPNVPVNDHCANAISLPVSSSCIFQNYSALYHTSENGIAPAPTCGFFAGGDVWFKAIVPASGQLRIEKQNGTGMNVQYTIYQGVCGAFTALECLQLTNAWTLHDESKAGQELYIRVYHFNEAEGGSFSICAWEPAIPDNDFCANAISLPVESSCNPQTFSNAYCTGIDPSSPQNPSCGFYTGGDVWFQFVFPASGHLRVDRTNISSVNASYTFYTGSCGAFTELACAQNRNNYTFHDESLAGQTIYIRIYNLGNKEGGTFSLCVWEPAIPDFDFCENAIELNVGASCVMQPFSNLYCTGESLAIAPIPTCGFYQQTDVWFYFTVPENGTFRIERNNLTGGNAQYAIYTGTCGNFTQLVCLQNQPTYTYVDEELAGQTLYLRVWSLGSSDGGTFDICIWDPFIPAYDNCANAVNLPVLTECIPQVFTNQNCTQEVHPTPSCAFYEGGDVWFTFVMPMSGHLRIERTNLANFNIAYAIYSGSCGSLSELFCAQNFNSYNIHDESLAGQTLYLRAYTMANVNGGPFSLCIWEPEMPDNDFCEFAELLTFGSPCSLDTIDGRYGTKESTLVAPFPSCGFYISNDLWFKVEVPDDGLFTVNKETLYNGGDTELAVYSGTCGNFTEIECISQTDQLAFDHPSLAGQFVYLRFFPRNNYEGDLFTLNVTLGAAACEGDFDNSGIVGTTDLLGFLGVFGDPSPCGVYDLNGDNTVSVTDFLLFISFFGSVCN